MKSQLQALIYQALQDYSQSVQTDLQVQPEMVQLERTKDSQHGDYACNIAMVLAKQAKMAPRHLAEQICNQLSADDTLAKWEVAGPGFINLFLSEQAYHNLIEHIRQSEQGDYGMSNLGQGQSVLIEFVSANPTGPLHVGHGRGAAYGDTLVRILRATGYKPYSEYYVNDAGRQMDILALSVWLRYQQDNNPNLAFPEGAYQGDYIVDMANEFRAKYGEVCCRDLQGFYQHLPEEIDERLDILVERARTLLGEKHYSQVFQFACDSLVDEIRTDLNEFGVTFDNWFSERSLLQAGDIEKAIVALQQAGHLYEQEGALWFRSTHFGDDKDRVVKRANGVYTYFASDLAYHFNKGQRGFDRLINIFGADHHGYVTRIKAAFEALGHDRNKLEILLVQFAILYRGGQKAQMSTRSGEFVTLRQLREEVGKDAARFYYVLRKADQHMDFDLDLAKTQSKDNPIYYIQYAHARICRVFERAAENQLATPKTIQPDLSLLTLDRELELMRMLARYPEMVELAARDYTPHTVAFFLRELANAFHAYYDAHAFLSSENDLRVARLALVDAIRVVIANGLSLLGVNAPREM